MRSGPRALPAVILGVMALGTAGCGSSATTRGLLSGGQSSTISGELSAIATAVDNRSCGAAQKAVSRLETTLGTLGSGVDAKLANNLGQGATRVKSLALSECHSARAGTRTSRTQTSTTVTTTTTTMTTPTATSTTAPTTQSTPTVSTETQTTATTPTPTTPTTPTPTTLGTTTSGGAGLTSGG